MSIRLFIYDKQEDDTRRMAQIIGFTAGYGKIFSLNELPAECKGYSQAVFIYKKGCGSTENFLKQAQNRIASWKENCEFAFLEITGENKNSEVTKAFRKKHEEKSIFYETISEAEDFIDAAAKVSNQLKKFNPRMESEQLKASIEEFIKAHDTFALATGAENYVRCTPIEYQFIDGNFYIITEGGLKFRSILKNSNVSMGIYEPYSSMQNLRGLQVMGKAEIVPYGSEEYYHAFAGKGISKEQVSKLMVNMHILKIKPYEYEILNSDFRKMGYDSRQRYVFEMN